MKLASGARLGPYEIVAPIGAGGMGEVYKGRDTRLDRAVAIKILSSAISASPDARRRFEREARTISQLSHPHICALYDVGEAPPPSLGLDSSSYRGPAARAEGAKAGSPQPPTPSPQPPTPSPQPPTPSPQPPTPSPQAPAPSPESLQYLVMELLEGETLAERLAAGALPLELTLRYAIQISDALASAHKDGIVHRDLKPSNVMVTRTGIKLLDFGLAKPADVVAMSVAETSAPALPVTAEGAIAGTVQYMAPEQLAGRPADARSDIYALAAVIYEMASGRPAFGGATHRLAPASLDRIVRTCLAGDPDERWQAARDVGLQLTAIADDEKAPQTAGPRRARGVIWAPWLVAGVAALAAIGSFLRPAPANPLLPSVRFAIPPPPDGAFADSIETTGPSLSADGTQLAFVGADAAGARRIFVRALSALESRPLAGTEGARMLFWAPDGRSIGFFVGDKLKRLDVAGGSPVTLADVPELIGLSGTWGRDDILFAAIGQAIYRVPANGGTATIALQPDRSHGEIGVAWPVFLPDGRRFLYLMRRADGSGSLMVAEAGTAPRAILDTISPAHCVDPGYLVFAHEGTLVGQRFDVATATATGESFPIAEPVRYFLSTGAASFAASRNGVLVYQAHTEQEGALAWFDRTGQERGTVGGRGGQGDLRISPDGQRIVYSRAQAGIGTFDLWMFDTARNIETRLTSDRLSEIGGVWLPAGNDIIFAAQAPPHIFRKDLGSGVEREILPRSAPSLQYPEDISPDGRTIVYTQRTTRGNADVWSVPVAPPHTPTVLIETPFDESGVRFSPDGRFIAYAGDESGRREVYVAPYPFTGEKTRISNGGGSLPRWSRATDELFYISADRHLVAVPVRTRPLLTAGQPTPLFAIQTSGSPWTDTRQYYGWSDFDVSRDGQRFLAAVPRPSNQQPLTAVLNWPRELNLPSGTR